MSHRILIVDDDPDITALIRLWLERDGHAVDSAHDGPIGLNAALLGGYDLAFIDIGLPVMDGYEVARKIRAAPSPRPCLVALTASTDDPRKAFDAGFDAHVLKPVSADAIAAVLNELPHWKAGH